MAEGVFRGVWVTEAGGEREARLRFLAERGLRLLMADVDAAGREALHFFDPREGKTLHLLSPEGGGLVEAASRFFPSATRWMELLYGPEGSRRDLLVERQGTRAEAKTHGGGGVERAANGEVLYSEGGLLLEVSGGRVLRVTECLRQAPCLSLRGVRVGKEAEKVRGSLGSDLPLLLSFLLALEDARGYAVPASARAVRAALLELLRMRSHCSWLSRAAELCGRFRLSRRLRRWGEGVAELEDSLSGGGGGTAALVPGGARHVERGPVAREIWNYMEVIAREWEELSRSLSAFSPPRWAEGRLAVLPREEGRRRGKELECRAARGEGWEAWVGPLARALGAARDARAEDQAFPRPPGWSPRAAAGRKGTLRRMVEVMAGEVADSLAILEALLREPPEGPREAPLGRRGSGRGFGRCEGPGGETCCHLALDRGRIEHAAFSLPVELNRSAAFCLEGAWLDEAEELLPLLLMV